MEGFYFMWVVAIGWWTISGRNNPNNTRAQGVLVGLILTYFVQVVFEILSFRLGV